MDSNKPLPKINILQAMKHLVSPWNSESKETIVNCFKKPNISQSKQQAAVKDDDDQVCKFARGSREIALVG